MAFVGEPVTRRRRQQTGVDRYGEPVFTRVDVPLVERAAFDPGGTREPVEVGREQVTTTPKAFFPRAWPDIVPTDVLVIRGREYRVQGDPADWRSPFGTDLGGLTVELEAVEQTGGA